MREREESQKVQFFESSTSEWTSIISESRSLEFVNLLLNDAHAIFQTLKKTVSPVQDLVNAETLQHIIHLAKILCKETIPSYLSNQKRLPKASFQFLYEKKVQLEQLIHQYQQYKNSVIKYQQFYHAYGDSVQKKLGINNQCFPCQNMKEKIEIIQHCNQKSFRRIPMKIRSQSEENYGKEIRQLRQQLNIMKKKQRSYALERSEILSKNKVEINEKIQEIQQWYKKENKYESKLKEQILQLSEKYNQQLNKEQQYKLTIQKLKIENNKLVSQISQWEKSALPNTRRSSAPSYRSFNYENIQNRIQIEVEQFQKKQSSLEKVEIKIHGRKIHTQQFEEEEAKTQKILFLKQNVIPRTEKNIARVNTNLLTQKYLFPKEKKSEIEGYQYYELLKRQFRIRYRRACLKKKQLLFKNNCIQIGVVSQLLQSNQIMLNLYFTGLHQEKLQNIENKIFNSSGNQINKDHIFIESLENGKQKKQRITVRINNYPLGFTLLFCKYKQNQKEEQLRVLLPIHVFKAMIVKPRDSEFKSPKMKTFKAEKKIIKQKYFFDEYFDSVYFKDRTIKCSIIHKQTSSKLLMDLTEDSEAITLVYEHTNGDRKITSYYIQSLILLMKKES